MKQVDVQAIRTLDSKAVFGVKEASVLLGITHAGLLNRIKCGKMQAVKNGSRYYLYGKEIQKQIVIPEAAEL